MFVDATDTAETSVELLREFELTGDSAVFEAFMRRHASMVYATCLKVTRDPHDAEDATQATFLTLASKSRLNGEIRQPEAWLRKVAHRLSLDLIRSKKRRINRENVRSEMTSEAAPLDSSDHADKGEVKGILNEELAKLPASYRMPLVLHYFGGLSREEMADQLKLKPSTLGVRLHRAREQLRKRLSKRGVVLPSVALTALLGDAVQRAVSDQIVAATAQQASAILAGQAMSTPAFSVAASAWVPPDGMIQSIVHVIARSKVKLIASTVILGSAIGVTNAKVQELLPAAVRDWVPALRWPSLTLPRFERFVPLPTLTAKAAPVEQGDDVSAIRGNVVGPRFGRQVAVVAQQALTLSVAVPAEKDPAVATSSSWTEVTTTPLSSFSFDVPDLALARVDIGLREPSPAAEMPRGVASKVAFNLPTPGVMTAPSAAVAAEISQSVAAPNAGTLNRANWGGLIAESSGDASFGPSIASLGASPSAEADAPEHLVAPVVGESPLASGNPERAGVDQGFSTLGRPKRSKARSQTVVFAGTGGNYGGYSDDAWNQNALADLSQTLAAPTATPTFDQPIVSGSGLSVNGARVTLYGVDDPTKEVAVTFLDVNSAEYPALPAGHHFIGAWSIESAAPFEAAELLVRYDDLRAARLGLSEQILKLWVSDGETWTLLWKDPTFGRDVNENLMWVTTLGEFKFFAASAPEPAAALTFVSVLAAIGRRRRRV